MDTCIEKMIFDQWNGIFCYEGEAHLPTIDDVLGSVEQLDAKTRTLVTVFARNGSTLTIGGGDGNYVAYIETGDQFWNLTTEEKNRIGRTILVNAGGQEGDFPPAQVVTRSEALRAAEAFFRTGAADPLLRWELQK